MDYKDELLREWKDSGISDIEYEIYPDIINTLMDSGVVIINNYSYVEYNIIGYFNKIVQFKITSYNYHFKPEDLWKGTTIGKQVSQVKVQIDNLSYFLMKKQIK